jgi:CheY-like chemotaxis protein
VATTLLAIDDSVTMRKVLEMTFAGEDYRVVTAESADAGLAKLRAERPAVVLCDVTLEGPGGYALCAKIKAENPTIAVVILASKQQPYDSQKGQGAHADDYIEKPFDTQQLVEKIKRLATRPVAAEAAAAPLGARPVGPGGTTQPGVPPASAPLRPTGTAPLGVARPAGPPAQPLPMIARPATPVAASSPSPQPVGRGTLSYGGPAGGPSTSPAPSPVAAAPASFGRGASPPGAPVAATPSSAAPAAPPSAGSTAMAAGAMATAANGQLAAKLAHLGLTDVQVSAVLTLSREVVEKVVWEVVPVLAETMIREEIKRLTSE